MAWFPVDRLQMEVSAMTGVLIPLCPLKHRGFSLNGPQMCWLEQSYECGRVLQDGWNARPPSLSLRVLYTQP